MLLNLLFALNAQAAVHNLNYNYKGVVLTVMLEANDYIEAIDKGADKCMGFYFTKFPVLGMTEDEKLELVDTCANPRKNLGR